MMFFCRNRKGKVIKAAPFQASVSSGEVARVEPNRKWFGEFMVLVKENKRVCVCKWCLTFCSIGNTRVISQPALQAFQEHMGKVLKDPYKVEFSRKGSSL